MIDNLKLILEKVCLDFDAKLVEFNGENDHVYLLVNYPRKIALSSLDKTLKSVSTRMIRKKYHSQIKSKL